MLNQTRHFDADHPLELAEVLAGLVADRYVSQKQCDGLTFTPLLLGALPPHPLVTVAQQNWHSLGRPPLLLTLDRLSQWLAEHVGLPYYRIDPLKIDVGAVTRIVSHAYATRFRILPVAISGNRVTVATAQPYVQEWETELTRMLGLNFDRVIANPETIDRYLNEFYAISRSIDGAVSNQKSVSPLGDLESLVELGKTGELDANDQHVVRIVDWLMQYAFDQRASDIHLEPRRGESNIRFRIDGILHLVHQIPTPVLAAVVSRIKALGRMDIIERRRPQDGRVKTKTPAGREVEVRLSTMPTTFGEKLVMRIFDPDILVKSLPELGLSVTEQKQWTELVNRPHGVVVVTGPTGSGKTTTLYAAMKQLARPDLNICTIEDPIEQVDPALNQMHVQANIGLSFASGVRTLLRQDPDIIMVGEIRDSETADAAIQSALTGHLVLTTLHTNDAPSTITRFMDLGVQPYLLKAALVGVIAQRLVRTLCPHCKQPAPVDPNEWAALVAPLRARPPVDTFDARGCDECRHTGFLGRIGIYEIMTLNDKLSGAIGTGTDARELRKLAIHDGMRPLRISGAEKVMAGLTTVAEVFSAVPMQ